MIEPPQSQAAALETGCPAVTLESISDAVLVLDRSWNIRYMNGNAERLLQVRRAEVMGRNVWQVFPEAVDGPYHRAYQQAVETNSPVAFEEHYVPLDLWTEIRAYPSEAGLTIYFRDISERKAAEARIHSMAFYDQLTGLPNRQLLLDRAGHALSLGHLGAMLFIDLDNFKTINDTRGHDKGDMLLQMVAARLRAEVRGCDTVARFGGDEFIVLLEDLGATENDAATAAQEIALKIVHAFSEPFAIDGMDHHSTPSIGITVFSGGNVDEVLKRADLAMYQAKAAGRNTVSFFDPAMQARVSARAALEADLRRALGNGEFVLHYQPLMCMDGAMAGAEALVRWSHPQRGMVSPADFIPVAEESNLILPLGRWVMREACQRLAAWAGDARTAGLEMAVNVSASQFHRPDFVEHVLETLAQTGARADRLRLELTESLLLKDVGGTVEKMQRLRAAGVSFALDDFGTGYSSLSYLHRLPLDQLKIDRSFIWGAAKEDSGAAIVRIIVSLGRALNMSVLAEGVETQAQLDFVIAEGCQYYQGYLFSKPLPEPELLALIANL
ncbi:putative bifunctional diguanylate cyclase/phosphodiesterase [Duganella vulcania]|uniref:EAL domain-containing protein n=1 Tax=Duganella vulcania TaxID=2692166 RepID=A0A845GMH7_9BURK|nr:EAL domain-containing protein [Duganella vulcania]MYM94625.1 EAL domain-containing protein [Duganella vulcania]